MSKLRIGVINPYAVAEAVVERTIRWDTLKDRDGILANILQTPKKRIFDLAKSPILNPLIQLDNNGVVGVLTKKKAIKRIAAHWKKNKFVANKNLAFSDIKPKRVISVLSSIVDPAVRVGGTNDPWEPDWLKWRDKGDFFQTPTGEDYYEDPAECDDPIQGGSPDCYFIAALSSVARSRPGVIIERSLPLPDGNRKHKISFYNGNSEHVISVEEPIPVTPTREAIIYARSFDRGEVWPGVMEKAYAKWKSNNKTDKPPYDKIAYGNPITACAELIRGARKYKKYNKNFTYSQIWWMVHDNCDRYYMIENPMVTWTYPQSPPGKDYGEANIVPNHAYSILGCESRNGALYIILRNPYGTKEATVDTRSGVVDRFRLPLNINGVFSMKAKTFKDYFEGIGWVV